MSMHRWPGFRTSVNQALTFGCFQAMREPGKPGFDVSARRFIARAAHAACAPDTQQRDQIVVDP